MVMLCISLAYKLESLQSHPRIFQITKNFINTNTFYTRRCFTDGKIFLNPTVLCQIQRDLPAANLYDKLQILIRVIFYFSDCSGQNLSVLSHEPTTFLRNGRHGLRDPQLCPIPTSHKPSSPKTSEFLTRSRNSANNGARGLCASEEQ